jgi:hypothetical protein
MIRIYSRTIAAAALALAMAPTFAQGTVDIGLHYNGHDALEVKVRPTSDFDGIFSSLVFALRWDKNSDITLGNAVSSESTPYVMTTKSGQKRENGMFAYQVYAGFGYEPMTSSGNQWTAGEEYTVLTIPVTGKGVVELVNDDWTSEMTNNADYYASLSGADHTGIIYKSMAATSDLDGTVRILPNPNEGLFTFSFMSNTASDITVDVLNTLGQSVHHENLIAFEGTFQKEMDLTHMSEGIYYLKIGRGDNVSVHKIIYR